MTRLATKMPTKQIDISIRKEVPKSVQSISLSKKQSQVIDIGIAPQKKSSSNIFAVQDPKYVEFVDELEINPQNKSPFLSPDKLINTVNLNQENKENKENLGNSKMLGSENIEVDPIVIKAIYEKEANAAFAKEKNIPDLKKYYPLGYDLPKNRLDPALTKKHYRLFLESALESSKYMDHHIFDEFIITRGNKAVSSNSFTKMMGIDESPKALGIFKCFIEVLNEKDKNALEASRGKPLMELFDNKSEKSISMQKSQNKTKKLDLDKEFMQASNVVVRVHILEVYNLVQLDSDSIPNPYIVVRLGEQSKDVKIKKYF